MKKSTMIFLSLLGGITVSAQQPADLIITPVKVIDVNTGKITPNQAIVVRHDTILAVTTPQKAKQYIATRTFDGGNHYAMPGLWDNHMHFGGGDTLADENKNFLPLYLAHGITTIRDCSADISQDVLKWREEVNSGQLQGPTIFTSGPKLEGYKSVWLNDLEIGTTAELNQALDSLQRIHVDFVKITDNTIKPELYLEAVKAARKRGMIISGHVPYVLTMQQVTDAGLSSVEHLSYVWKAGVKDEAALSRAIASGDLKGRDINRYILTHFDTTAAMKAYRHMAAKGTAVTPTLSLGKILAYFDQDDHAHDPYLAYIGKGLQKTYEMRVKRVMRDDSAAIAYRKEIYEKESAILPLLQKAGVMIMAGTDAGYLNSFDYPGIGLHRELALMVHFGLTPLQALQASVVNSPVFLHQQRYGTLAAGKRADILLLNANPLEDIHNTEKIQAVVTKGQLLDRATLDQLLNKIKAGNAH
ncbi:amidohydrolase family protein [Chitinophaga qingshengii]|uniref:Amidohydrolase family protein n=1 Tax=Chitinophaga qingshengii TaxID=1569794 RepID=A0ABR7TRT8_9BACT|nr:amidohydrolase family protein [Chitinophaga qingshengii]MBC9932350.1 amidohydrolase family protein [Chitinophaga qingshengii]